MSDDTKVILTTEEALSMLPDGDSIHTFRSNHMCLIGADYERVELIKKIKENQCEIGGDQCQKMNHGLVVWTSKNDPLFLECREGVNYDSFT